MNHSQESFTVKLKCGKNVKRFQIPIKSTFHKFECMVQAVLGIPSKPMLKYLDEEGDMICLGGNEEYEDVIQKVLPKTKGVLKVSVALIGTESGVCRSLVDPPTEQGEMACEVMKAQKKHRHHRKRRSSSTSSSSSSSSSSDSSDSDSSGSSSSGSSSDSDDEEGSEMPQEATVTKKMMRQLHDSVIDHVRGDMKREFFHMYRKLPKMISTVVAEELKQAGLVNTNEEKRRAGGRYRKRQGKYHRNIVCDGCDSPIRGIRYKCGNCGDFDLCEMCEGDRNIHDDRHVFIKLYRPAYWAGRNDNNVEPLLKEPLYRKSQAEKQKCRAGRRACRRNFKNSRQQSVNEQTGVSQLDVATAIEQEQNDSSMQTEQSTVADSTTQITPPTTQRSVSTDSTTLKDDNVRSALSGLKLVQSTPSLAFVEMEDTSPSPPYFVNVNDVKMDYLSQSPVHESRDEDGVIVVTKKIDETPQIQEKAASVGACHNDSATDDFVVVPIPHCFDPNVPLDNDCIQKHKDECRCITHRALPKFLASDESSSSEPGSPRKELIRSVSEGHGVLSKGICTAENEQPSTLTRSMSDEPTQVKANLMDQSIGAVNDSTCLQPTPSQSSTAAYDDIKRPIISQPKNTAPAPVLSQPLPMLSPSAKTAVETQPPVELIRPSTQQTVDDTLAKGIPRATPMIKPPSYFKTSFKQPSPNFTKTIIEHRANALNSSEDPHSTLVCADSIADQRHDAIGNGMADYLASAVDAAVNAVNAVGETMTNAMHANRTPPTVKFADGKAEINVNKPMEEPVDSSTYPDRVWPVKPEAATAVDKLVEMGFADRKLNEELLTKYNQDVEMCVAELVERLDNNWSSTRH